jgi:hypothetical protein
LALLKGAANSPGRSITGHLNASNTDKPGLYGLTVDSGSIGYGDNGAQISGTGIPTGDTIAKVLSSSTALLAMAPSTETPETLAISADVNGPDSLTPVANGSYPACVAPCMTSLALNGNNDTFSAPFYDYKNDALYVGDDSGYLHKFTPVFNGTPAEVVTCESPPVGPCI